MRYVVWVPSAVQELAKDLESEFSQAVSRRCSR